MMAIRELAYASHEEWLNIRAKYIGGSDASAVIGMNPWMSRYSLWAEKTGRVPPFEGNLRTEAGAYLEEFVAQKFTEATGKKVRRKNRTLINDQYPWACANLDRTIVGENAFLECKTTNSHPVMRTIRGSEEFPEVYYAQVVHYLAVSGMKKAYLAVLIDCSELRIFELERDEDEIAALMDAEREFWELVTTNTAPAPDGTESTKETISTLYPESDGSTVDLVPFEATLREYASLTAQIKALTELRDEKSNIIREYMKEAERGESAAFRVSYASSVRKTFDAKRFAEDHAGEDLSGYYKTTNTRVFKVTEKGGDK